MAMAYDCEQFVLISTDKAVNPVNIMGASKRLCEMIIQTFAKKIEQGQAQELPDMQIFEVNTGAMARGYRTSPYPMPFILKELKNLGGKVTISSDCHDKNYLNYYFDESIQLVKSCGFDKLTVLSKGEFKEIKI